MKYLISTTGSKFPFMLTADKRFVFDPIVPTQIEDGDLGILQKRLGNNISLVDVGAKITSKKVVKENVVEETEPKEEEKELE